LKISYREYLAKVQRCDLCNQTGINLNEILQISKNKENQINIIVLKYLLFSCSKCKACVHENCLASINPKIKFPFYNVNEKSSFKEWTCEQCLEANNPSAISAAFNFKNNRNNHICFLCEKDAFLDSTHVMVKIENNLWVHGLCLIWFLAVDSNKDENLIGKSFSRYFPL